MEGKRFYNLELENGSKTELARREKDFARHALVQIELINSILVIIDQLNTLPL